MKNSIIKNYKFIIKMITVASPYRIISNILMTVISSFFSIFYNVLFFSYFMKCVSDGKSILYVIKVLVAMIIVNIVFECINSYYIHVYLPKDDVRLSKFFKNMIYHKILTIDIECFDNPQYYDNVTFALKDLFERIKSILFNISQFVTHLFCVFVMITYFIQIDFIIALITFIAIFLGLFLQPIINKYKYKCNMESIVYERKFDYMKRIVIQAEYAQELRTTHVKNVLLDVIGKSFDNLNNLVKNITRRLL